MPTRRRVISASTMSPKMNEPETQAKVRVPGVRLIWAANASAFS